MNDHPPPLPGPAPSIVPGNRLLAALPPRDLALLAPCLERVALRRGQVLFEAGAPVPWVVFPELGTLPGLFAPEMNGHRVKIACADRTRALGMAEALDGRPSLTQAAIVLPGPALRIAAADFAAAAQRSDAIRDAARHAAELLLAEAMRNAACNTLHDPQQRVARWLLAVHDLMQDPAAELPLTQHGLGDMLGLPAAVMAAVAGGLEAANLIAPAAAGIRVHDRASLAQRACDCNQAVAGLWAVPAR